MADESEVEQRVREGLPMVESTARRVTRTMGRSGNLDDCISAGQLALLKAARQYNPDGAMSFMSYAKDLVEYAILDALRKTAPVPRRAREQLAASADANSQGRSSSDVLERRRDKYLAARVTAQANGLLAQLGLDTQGEATAISVKTSAEHAAQRTEAREMLQELPSEEAEVVRRHYLEHTPLDRVAIELGITRYRATTLHDSAIARLKKLANVQ